MPDNRASELQCIPESKRQGALGKWTGNSKRKVTRPKVVATKCKSTLQRPNKTTDKTTRAKNVVWSRAKIQQKRTKSMGRRKTKRGKGRRRRRMIPKSGEERVVDLKEDISSWKPSEEEGGGCYCSQLKEGVRKEGMVRGGSEAGSKCWVCRLREMVKKCKQLRGSRVWWYIAYWTSVSKHCSIAVLHTSISSQELMKILQANWLQNINEYCLSRNNFPKRHNLYNKKVHLVSTLLRNFLHLSIAPFASPAHRRFWNRSNYI